MEEVWRVLPEWPAYAVSNHGRVKRLVSRTSAKAGAILRQCERGGHRPGTGYLAVDLSNGPIRKTVSVHILVANAFIGERPLGMVPNHKDGDRNNNCADNLEWATQSRNVKHAYDIGLSDAKGECNGQAKLTSDQVRKIRRLSTGRRGEIAAFAVRFNISPRQVSDIIKGKAWPHLLAA